MVHLEIEIDGLVVKSLELNRVPTSAEVKELTQRFLEKNYVPKKFNWLVFIRIPSKIGKDFYI